MITLTDLFCGAGGSGLGATAVPGVQLVMAANHSPRAIETHALNFPDTEHDIADISQVEPSRYQRTNILWASPECTNHSIAQGRKRDAQPDLFGDHLPDHVSERSRSTMWDVPRFAEVHKYDAVIVENVVDAAKWPPFKAWLMAMEAYGYDHHIVYLNSMHAPAIKVPRAPQSRDRMYVVFWKRKNRTPNLDIRPWAHCRGCAKQVQAMQVFKHPGKTWPAARWGRYRAQYAYRCPTPRCHAEVEPYALPAASAIDWDLRGRKIGDREIPLKPATLARIKAGLARYAVPQPVPSGGTWNEETQPVDWPMRTRTTRETEGLLVPVEGRDGKNAQSAAHPMRTQTARLETALVVPHSDQHRGAFIAELRGGGSDARRVQEPLSTVCASGTHHMLVRNNSSKGDGGEMCTPATEPARTITTRGHQSLVGWSSTPPEVDDCEFRMLAVPEIQAAMAFTPEYIVTGNKREQVRQLGNGVTPPSAEWLIRSVVRSLEGDEAA
jgi:DNA (cytosine-5)-methyltransferase 1